MEVKIKDDDKNEIIFSDDIMDNVNFVDMIINGKEYTLSVEELHCAIMPFIIKKDRDKELNN